MFKSLALSAASVLMLFSGGVTASASTNEVNTKNAEIAQYGFWDDLKCQLYGSPTGCVKWE
ncbi:hypothetical protein [Bacillus gaemokensis]|uniref:Chitinase n=1 Tax=Bacillus gaemokensis TaxID=574375 RepID=A0A073K537_9BACI|nr:hypothetical protein [Bacillus gaemokensis]KEK21661.1 hypothetical protein BAGA_27430 [Bacillus gaemokensis]KYG32914.1 hypothetical protein AZF08_27390 [Bacillus gaemokensis]